MKRQLLLVSVILALSTFISAQNSETVKIDSQAKAIDSIVKKRSPDIVLADVSNYENNETAKWQRFASKAALEKHRKKDETYSIAYCWKKDGKLAAANFTLFSPSGDWTKYVYSYYRPDGTLAKAAIDYRTFNGDIILKQNVYFNANGKVIKDTRRALDLSTQKPKKLTKAVKDQVAVMAKEADYYKSTSELPFAKQLK